MFFFHHGHVIPAAGKVAGTGKIAKAVFVVFNGGNAAIAIFKIMKCNEVLWMLVFDMVLDAKKIVEALRFGLHKGAFPFDIEIGALAKTAVANTGAITAFAGFYQKAPGLWLHVFHS